MEGTPGKGYGSDHQSRARQSAYDIDSSKAKKLLGEWIPYEKSVQVVDTDVYRIGVRARKCSAEKSSDEYLHPVPRIKLSTSILHC